MGSGLYIPSDVSELQNTSQLLVLFTLNILPQTCCAIYVKDGQTNTPFAKVTLLLEMSDVFHYEYTKRYTWGEFDPDHRITWPL